VEDGDHDDEQEHGVHHAPGAQHGRCQERDRAESRACGPGPPGGRKIRRRTCRICPRSSGAARREGYAASASSSAASWM
jgi:hypothetical protein